MTIKISDEDFIALWKQHESVAAIAKITGIAYRAVLKRRANIEKRHDIILKALDNRGRPDIYISDEQTQCDINLDNGVIIVGSDCHYNPKYVTTAHRAFVQCVKHLKPKYVILNGDLFDFASISAHHRIGWQHHPTVKEELEETQARLADIEAVRPAGCKLLITIGNHDLRFSGKLSNVLPQYEGIKGFDIADHTPLWKWYWSIMVNGTCMIKHRWHNGVHAVYNNILKSGTSFISGHLHSLKVTPWTDYTGTRYGVDTGTMACVKDQQFIYAENNPLNWRSGFAVLTFNNGRLMPPELAEVVDEDKGLYYFRGQVMKV
jgi:Calcineurin-like phosphoesterase